MLVRAPQSGWRKSSIIAVDAGAHLASIIRILEQHMPMSSLVIPPKDHIQVLEKGPFADVPFPWISAKANALFIFRELLHSFLITHPHLDHLSGMAINTPALEYGREAKAIVALPSTIDAIKSHIFNDHIWPNLSDEGHGVGFVTYRRLIEGGNPRLGFGDARGYVNVCDGLATKCWSVSHGKCHRQSHSMSHPRGESFGWNQADYNFPSRRMSRISDEYGYFAAVAQQQAYNQGGHAPAMPPQMAMPPGPVTPGLPAASAPVSAIDKDHMFEPVSSSAFFIRNDISGDELLIFGDTEPDSLSMSPRNHIVWDDAAPKIESGRLRAIFIECSYDDSVRNQDLYGHLCPRHLVAELTFLAKCVMNVREQKRLDAERKERNTSAPAPFPAKAPFVTMQEPPTPADMKRKRKRIPNGDLPSTPEIDRTHLSTSPQPPPLPQVINSPYVGVRSVTSNRSTSATRRKTSHPALPLDGYPMEQRPLTPSRLSRHVQIQEPGQVQAQTSVGAFQPPNIPAPSAGRAVPAHPPALPTATTMPALPTQPSAIASVKEKLPQPLKGVTVHIIHVKDPLMDGPTPGEIIEAQLREHGESAGLGCEFDVTSCGESIWV